MTQSNPSFDAARHKVIEALSKKPETKGEWEKLIQAAEEILKVGGAQ